MVIPSGNEESRPASPELPAKGEARQRRQRGEQLRDPSLTLRMTIILKVAIYSLEQTLFEGEAEKLIDKFKSHISKTIT